MNRNEAKIRKTVKPKMIRAVRAPKFASLTRNRIAGSPMERTINPCGLERPARTTARIAPIASFLDSGRRTVKATPKKEIVAIIKKNESASGQWTRIRMSTERMSSAAVARAHHISLVN